MQLNENEVLDLYAIMEERDYQVNSIRETLDNLSKKNDVLINLPTGTGKTIIYAPIAVAAANNKFRVCITCYTKYMQNKIYNDVKKFSGGKDAEIVMGDSNYECLKTGKSVDYWYCESNHEQCEKEGILCDKILKNIAFQNKNLIITNHAKFLKSKPVEWDLIIIDDSHSFENIVDTAYQYRMYYGSIDYLYRNVEHNEILADFVAIFLDYFDAIFESDIPTDVKQGTVSTDNIVNIASEIVTDKNDEEIRNAISSLNPRLKKIATDLYMFIKACKRASFHRFYLRKDWYDHNNRKLSGLIATDVPQNRTSKIRRIIGESEVILATATPGPPTIHANSCTKRFYDKNPLAIVPSVQSPMIQDWFKNLDILCVDNIGDTRKRNNMIDALEITLDIFKENVFKSILLFKNYTDQKLAYDKLSPSIDDIFFIESDSDQDEIQDIANKRQVILASASTRLWEGIDIQQLDLGIIYTPPFIRVPIEIPKNQEYPYNLRIMLRRLQQGIGRMIRNVDDRGLCLLMDTNFNKYVNQSQFSQQLRERTKTIHKEDLLENVKRYRGKW